MPSPAKKLTKAHGSTATGEPAIALPEYKRIARLAYSYWEARGRPEGSAEEDWFRAEEELRRRKAAFTVVKERRRSTPLARTRSRSRKNA